MASKIDTLSKNVDKDEKYEADLEQALSVVGFGVYNIRCCLIFALFLIAAIVEPVGYSYILPSNQCDLEMTNTQRGFIASIPYIGIVLTSFPWGYLVDTRGRRPILFISSMAAGLLGILAGFMPELISFTACKFLASLCIACPAAAPYSYIGEVLPQQYRDITLSITNSMQILGSAIVPLLAWGVLPLDFRTDFGAYEFRPWRLLCMLYSVFFIIAALLLFFTPESPKFLVSQGKHDEAFKVLQSMYAVNKGKSPEEFPIRALKIPDTSKKPKKSFLSSLKEQTTPLVTPPYLKWMCLNGFLLFGVFNILNGLYMWVPDVLNRVLTGDSSGELTACEIMGQRANNTPNAVCDDTIDPITFTINSIASIACACLALIISTTVKFLGKKILLILIFLVIGILCVLINVIRQQIVFAIILSAIPLGGLCIGPVNAYSVDIFPTHLRGMAVSLSMMIGRTGSIFGANVAGAMINTVCDGMFYMFGGLFIFCGLLSLLLPKSETRLKPKKAKIVITRI